VLGRLSGALASVIFPSDCRICESLLETASRLPICNDCLASFRRNPLESCDVCGVPWGVPGESDEEFAICPECREQKYGFERARSYGQYEGTLARAIVLLKYQHIQPLGKWFADRLLEVVRADEKRLWGDMVVPVPFNRQRTRLQPSRVICKAAGKAPGDPVPAGAANEDAATARETAAGLRGKMGIGTWRFCAEARRAS
jgi:predicted amidophosphoribosyltransferase